METFGDLSWKKACKRRTFSSKSHRFHQSLVSSPIVETEEDILSRLKVICEPRTIEFDEKFSVIIALGIGSFSISKVSLEQVAALCLIKDHCHIEKVVCYDPVFSHIEKQTLQGLEIECTEDYSSCFDLSSDEILFLMPHCDKSIYLDVIRSNINRIERVTIVGNDFRKYTLSSSGSEGVFWESLVDCMSLTAFSLCNMFSRETFNDTVTMVFKQDCLSVLQDLIKSSPSFS